MQKTQSPLLFFLCTAMLLFSCKKNITETASGLTAEERSKLNAYGLSAAQAYRVADGIIAEGDLFISNADLALAPANRTAIRAGEAEQYHVVNLVTGLPRTISIRYTGSTTAVSTAINTAIARYNALALRIRFTRVAATATANITVSNVSGVSYMATSGFPSATGNPYNSILFNTAYSTWPAGTLATLMAHQIGHCIGFAHTDIINQAFSCGIATGGTGGLTYIHIPGTPTGPDPNSWMLACINAGDDRPFNANDRFSLNYLY